MQLFVYFSILIIFSLWLQYEIRKNNRLSKKGTDEFWKKEAQANRIRRVDITSLDYITIPVDQLPLKDTEDLTINSYRDRILDLADKQILNLTGMTNTDLKLKYGTSNINMLSEYDNNYTVLVSILQKWGERLYSNGYIKEAVSVLEYAVKCNTDARNTYRLLAQIYIEIKTPDKINSLLETLPYTQIKDNNKLMDELSEIKRS